MPVKKVLLAAAACAAMAAVFVSAPRAARAWRRYQAQQRKAQLAAAFDAVKNGADAVQWPKDAVGREGGPEHDDPQLRQLAERAYWGERGPDFQARRSRIAAQEARRWASLMPRTPSARGQIANQAFTAASGPAFYNLGPGATGTQWNGEYYIGNDTGRPTAIRLDPADASGNTVFVATSGGGVWTTANALSATPTWTSITDACLGNLAVGAFEIVQNEGGSETLVFGIGDAFDVKGGTVATVTGDPAICANWTTTDPLSGKVGGMDVDATASSIRDLRVDLQSGKIWATTDVGLFVSSDGGLSFSMVYVGYSFAVSAWNLAYLGNNAGQSAWAVSVVSGAPQPGFGKAGVNLGDIVYTTDGGTTWSSMRGNGKLPPAPQDTRTTVTNDYGRIFVAVGPVNADPTLTNLWAQAGNDDESNTFFLAYLKGNLASDLQIKASPIPPPVLNAPVVVAQWQTAPTNPNNDCQDVGLGPPGGLQQAYYNQAAIVDPQDDTHALFGGAECSMRTIDDGASFQISSHWLPPFAGNLDGNGNPVPPIFPYVHADWHTGLAFIDGSGKTAVYAGTDGGFFISMGDNSVFKVVGTDNTAIANISWTQPDTGLITHLFYSVASGDPTLGAQRRLLGGLQDNGTRYRAGDDTNLTFNQVTGGDGIGSTVSAGPIGENEIAWDSVEFGRMWCKPGEMKVQGFDEFIGFINFAQPVGPIDCSQATTPGQGTAPVNQIENWTPVALPDNEQFFVRLQPLNDGSGAAITATAANIWRIGVDKEDNFESTQLTGFGALGVRNLYVSPNTYTWFGGPAHLYGVVLGGGNSAVLVEQGGNVTTYPSPKFLNTDGTTPITGTSSIDFPRAANESFAVVSGAPQTFIVSSVTPANVTSRVFRTTDGGNTWLSIQGNLPLVPVDVVRFDPADPSDNTIYAGTDIGLYRTIDGGTTWVRYGAGLPMVRVTDMTIARNGSLLRLSTFGRGLWEMYPQDINSEAVGNGDWDKNLQIDWIDVAALASRLGTQPAPVNSPHYDWTVDFHQPDQVGTGGACDGVGGPCVSDADLAQLLTKFGGAP